MNKIAGGRAQRVLVIGDANMTLSPEDTLAPDGMLILMEADPGRAESARQRFLAWGLDRRATVIAGDPRRMLHKLAGPFDMILAAASDPVLLEKLAPLLAADGVLITNGQR